MPSGKLDEKAIHIILGCSKVKMVYIVLKDIIFKVILVDKKAMANMVLMVNNIKMGSVYGHIVYMVNKACLNIISPSVF